MSSEDYQVRNVLSVECVAAYIRVSTQEQKLHGISLDAQMQKIQDYADQHNMRIVEWYKDEGVSGRKLIKNRPELQRMIHDAEAGKFERILFIKLDRFFRSVAEYHECMKRISPVVWSTTEEQYDLTTANGRMLVNMKLTIAELEADQGGERISIVNDYKVSTGQPITGSMPFGWKIEVDKENGKKKIVKDPDAAEAMDALIRNFLKYQSKHKTLVFAKTMFNVSISYRSLSALLKNPFLYGEYRGNPNYCEAYITKDEYNKIQEILDRNIKYTTKRTYIFSGLIVCPECGKLLKGSGFTRRRKNGDLVYYKKYRCSGNRLDHTCGFVKTVSENVLERMMLDNVKKKFVEAQTRRERSRDAEQEKISKHDIDALYAQLDRLNYSWQTGKIRKVEQYEKQYDALINTIEQAERERDEFEEKDFSHIAEILHDGWKDVYKTLDEEHKRAFWRRFVRSIELNWTTETKEIAKVNFY